MKNKNVVLVILILTISTSTYSQSQDSVRTRNDKPGTPSSLRTPDNSPSNSVHTITTAPVSGQSIYHGSLEGGSENNTNKRSKINQVNTSNGAVVQPTTNTNISNNNSTNNSTIIADSINSNGTLTKKPSNITDPTRR